MQRNKKKFLVRLTIFALGGITTVGLIILAQHRAGTQQLGPRGANSAPQVTLKTGDNLQQAINRAGYGDTIVLQAGATFTGPIVLPYKDPGSGTDAEYITIRTSDLSGISAEGERVDPGQHARAMPKIVAPNQLAALTTEPKAHHYKFIGIEFTPAPDARYVYNVIDLGTSDYNSTLQVPHHLMFDRCYVHSSGLNKARRGFALNSGDTSILNSYISGFAGAGDETQAIAGWNGPGPFHILNNYLEGGAEVLLFGGADPSIQNLIPSDIEIRRNYFHRPADWEGRATIKGMLELKNAKRVVIEGNLLDSSIRTTALVLTVRNQGGRSPWSTVQDVEISNNVIRHSSTGVNILGNDDNFPSQEARNIKISNNLFVDVASSTDIAYFLQTSGGSNITVSHNTVQQSGNMISAYGKQTLDFAFTNNIIQYNAYGIACFIEGAPCSDIPYCRCFPGAKVKGNVILDNANVSANAPIQNMFPPGNSFMASFEKIGFVNHKGGDWQLSSSSPIRGKAADGKDPGVDFGLLNASGVNSAVNGSRH